MKQWCSCIHKRLYNAYHKYLESQVPIIYLDKMAKCCGHVLFVGSKVKQTYAHAPIITALRGSTMH